jgi:hypothetical protein
MHCPKMEQALAGLARRIETGHLKDRFKMERKLGAIQGVLPASLRSLIFPQ